MEPISGNVFAAEFILRERKRKGSTEYLIKWKGWNSRHNSWEPTENILDERLLQEYETRKCRSNDRKRGGKRKKGCSSASESQVKKKIDHVSDEEEVAKKDMTVSEIPQCSTCNTASSDDTDKNKKENEANEEESMLNEDKKEQGEEEDHGNDEEDLENEENEEESTKEPELMQPSPPQFSSPDESKNDHDSELHCTGLPWSRTEEQEDEVVQEQSTSVGNFQYNNSCTLTDVKVNKTTVTFVEM